VVCVFGCSSNDNGLPDSAVPDLSSADGPADLASFSVNYRGRFVAGTATGQAAIGGATITVKELPSLSATTDSSGYFNLQLPTQTTFTLVMQAAGYPKTIQNPQILTAAIPSNAFLATATLAQADFDQLNAAAGVAAGSGVIGVTVVPIGACVADGSGVTLTATSGRIEYVPTGLVPTDAGVTGPSATTAFNAYVLGASGTVTVSIATAATCAAAPPPVSPKSFLTVPGAPAVVEPGTLTRTPVFLM
jgi:hypothetical protein